MKVLLVGDYPPPQGGIAVHVQQLHRFLGELGVPVRVLDVGKGGRVRKEVLPTRSATALALQLCRFAAEGFVVHLHTSGNNPRSWALAALALSGKPLGSGRVVTIHSGLATEFLAGSPARRLLARAALAGYARIVAVSEQVAESLERCGVPEKKLLVCPAFLASQARPGPPPQGTEEARGRHSPLLAFAHHPAPTYGRELMFEALALLSRRLPAVGLALFGPGTGSPSLRAASRKFGVERRLEDFGELEHPAALGLLARCDALVRPTFADGDSLSVREALALGVRCLASDAVARPEGAITFRTGQVQDLVQRLCGALRQPPPRVESPDAGPLLLGLYQELAGWHPLRHPSWERSSHAAI